MLTDQLQLIDLELRETPEGRQGLLSLLDDRSSRVRLRAAVAVLAFSPEVAVSTLESLASGGDTTAWEAGLILRQVRRGTFDVGWVPRGRVSRRLPQLSVEHLDSALTVHGLIMNGGLEHAWEVDREAFEAAVETLRTIGRGDAADVLASVATSYASEEDPAGANPDYPFRELDHRYLALPDVQDSIEDAVP
ncbi:DUF2019 domain-containing protein [Microbacterium sp. T32]|uniref:DUF2019 domain-containing protein n=2 Tax=Bacteria TaxID=2 RepID=UPI0007AC2899|nr:hypothetical protein AVW09_07720 [Microbacterium sp. T32]